MRKLPKNNLDDVDFKIANALRENARLSYRKLGDMISLSTASAYERVKKLEEQDVILDYRAEVDYEKFGYGIHAFILLKDDRVFEKVPDYLFETDYVQNCWVVTGEYDYLVEVRVENCAELSLIIDQLYYKIGRTYTLLIVRNARYTPYAKSAKAPA